MIAIAGAGIGGLTLGRALAHHGIPFHIYERAPELRAAGAGIALADNAFRALRHTGLAAGVEACGQRLTQADICEPSGRVITGYRVGELVPGINVAMSRAALQQALHKGDGGEYSVGTSVTGFEQRADGVEVTLSTGQTVSAAALIGADGLHSAVRTQMRGPEPLRYSGQTSWRALVRGFPIHPDGRFTETWGRGQRFGIVPIGHRSVYWFAVADAPAGQRDAGDVRLDLQRRFAGWHEPIAALIAATEPSAILRTDISDRIPIATWVDGRVALLGDAAHPMTPNMGMGGCQAIEDAVVLADRLSKTRDIPAALAAYQAARVARANSFVKRSYTIGRLAHARSAPIRWLRDRAFAAIPPGLIARAMACDLDFTL